MSFASLALVAHRGLQTPAIALDALLRCASCRYAAFYFLPFYVAVLDAGGGGWRWVLFGAVLWALHSFGTELVNRLSDRIEDRVNRPVRTAYCEIVGYRRIAQIAVAIWLAVLVIDLGWVASRPRPLLALLLALGIMAGVQYSYGLRFKRRTYFSNFTLTWPFGGPFLIGWAAFSPQQDPALIAYDFVARLGPFLLVVGTFIGTLAGIKDVPDIPGDEQIGYRSFWVGLLRSGATWRILGLITSPFVAVVALTSLDLLPPRFLLLLLFVPVSFIFAASLRLAAAPRAQQATRELFYQYWFAFLAVAHGLYLPTAATFWTVAGTLTYWILTSQYLHWSDGIRWWKVQALVRVLAAVPHGAGRNGGAAERGRELPGGAYDEGGDSPHRVSGGHRRPGTRAGRAAG